jgi:CelD/BcsL family acetyltransferase involved in cellulose biosynthesis
VTSVEILSPAARETARAIWLGLELLARPRYWLRWAWIETWLDSLPADRQPSLVVVRRAGEPIAAFFVGVAAVRKHGVLRWRAAHVQETGDPSLDLIYVEYSGWLARPDAEIDTLSVLDGLPQDWDELVLRRLAPTTPPVLDGIVGPYRLIELGRDPSPYVDLDAVRAAPDGYLSLLGRNTRAAIRRTRRHYEARGPLRLETAATLDEAHAFVAELAELSRKRFARHGGGAFASDYFRAFHASLIERRLAHGEVQLLRLRAGDHTIGLSYSFISDGIVSFYQSGITYEDDKRHKPGLLLHAEAIERAAQAGHRLYDFLAGAARYKEELATGAFELRSVRIQRRRPVFFVEERLQGLAGSIGRLLRGWA